MSANIDQLAPTKSLIDLSTHSDNDFGLQDFDICTLFDDLLLAEYVDETDDGNCISRGGIVVPKSSVYKAWRLAKVILVGNNCSNVKTDDIIIFPHDKGIPVKNITVDGHGKVNRGIFLNEERLFGIVKPKNDLEAQETTDETISSKSSKAS
jgi:hypothetical protein